MRDEQMIAENRRLFESNAELTAENEQLAKDYAEACDAVQELYEKAEMYRKQLGGTNAALQRMKQRVRELESENALLVERGAYYRAAFEDMMGHPLDKLEEVTG